MSTIWKYVLQPEISVKMPVDAKLLSVREQGDEICLWVLVDPDNVTETRHFVVYGTGHEVSDGAKLQFLGTAHINQGRLVFHVFEKVA